ncbi:PRC-barrel domain-containing protein [Kribbella sp. NPDC050124]|uniref:PRC-barrel domain-containing protein n=1 Tax=Kribbella sp. NPDC050124 TaxID=3364114 RepID=UPI0037A0A733
MADNARAELVRLKDTDLTVAGSAADVRGRLAVDANGDELGQVDDLFVDTGEQKVRFLQLGSGGFLGIGEKKVLVPVDAVAQVDDDKIVIDHERRQIAAAPEYDPDLTELPEPDFFESLYGYCGYPPFWGPGYRYPRYPLH